MAIPPPPPSSSPQSGPDRSDAGPDGAHDEPLPGAAEQTESGEAPDGDEPVGEPADSGEAAGEPANSGEAAGPAVASTEQPRGEAPGTGFASPTVPSGAAATYPQAAPVAPHPQAAPVAAYPQAAPVAAYPQAAPVAAYPQGAPGYPQGAPAPSYAQGAPGYPQGAPGGYGPPAPGGYPQQAYYAPGWTAPAEAASPRRGHTRLFLGLAIGLVSLLIVAGGVTWFLNWRQTRDLGEITGETSATAQQVRTGYCIQELPADGSVGDVTLVPCDEPHEAQVVGTHVLDGDDWPGQDVVDDEVTAWCEMDRAATELGFRPVVWTPSEAGWAQGDRRGVCIAWYDGGDVTGSFEDGDVQVS